MNFLENIHAVFRLIKANKVRSFLTMLGIMIGIMSVIVVLSAGAGAQSLILNQIKSMGSDLLGVLPGKSDENGPPATAFGSVITTLKYEDAKKLTDGSYPHLMAAAVYVKGRDTVSYESENTDTNFVGTNADYLLVEDTGVAQGRFFDEDEEKTMERVAVLGSEVADVLFKNIDPLGKKIKIKKTTFRVIGIMKKRGVSGFENQDNQLFIPVSTAQKVLLGIDYVSFMRLKVDNADNINDAQNYVTTRLRELHNIDDPEKDDFSVRSMASGIETFTNITNALKMFLTFIAAIALLVGGIGIMNIMLAAVEERTREIGLRKAVGAKSRHIVVQFLVETVMITFLGGLCGIILGIFISWSIAKVAQYLGYDWDMIVSWSSIILATMVSVGIGLLFGVAPAKRASRLDPIEALRYE